MTYQDRSQRLIDVRPEIFTAEDYLEARMMEDILDGVAIEEGLAVDRPADDLSERTSTAYEKLGIPQTERVRQALGQLVRGISETSGNLVTQIRNPLEDVELDYLSDEAREKYNLKPFSQKLRYIASRYIVEHVEEQAHYSQKEPDENAWVWSVEIAESMLGDLPRLVQTVYEVDIPAYTVLFQEFDKLRADSRYPVEVYLGRDGIYAYYGRIAEHAARGDNDPVTQQFPLSQAQLVLHPNPKYLVYSRGVMSNVMPERKKEYLAQFIDPKQDLHFYDTGYNGSIPQDIMTILGFKPEEIDQRIHMLDATSPARQLQGLPGHVNIEIIENHPKDEAPATGIADHHEGFKYVSEPASLEEQFKFLVIRDILLRHFWTKEYEEITEHLADHAVGNRLAS